MERTEVFVSDKFFVAYDFALGRLKREFYSSEEKRGGISSMPTFSPPFSSFLC